MSVPSGRRRAPGRGIAFLAALAVAACTPGTGSVPAPAPLAAADAVRVLANGSVQGFVNSAGGHSWLGIPYAAPPLGALRWRQPQPVSGWSDTRAALTAGAPCIQYGWSVGGVGSDGSHEGSEDCLYLNVYAPRLATPAVAAAHLPVMVWIHGGSNTVGHAAGYDGGALAEREHVLVVMLNYRLGPFGWFLMPAGAGGATPDPDDASGNFGILDALASLRWVQQNAAAFGGDPDNVTLFGESAGATDALAVLVSPRSRGLVHKVIVESLGFGFAPPARARNYRDDATPGGEYSSSEVLLRLLVRSGRAADARAARALADAMPADEIAGFLRGIEPWALYAAYHPSSIDTDKFPTVFQDGSVVPGGDLAELVATAARERGIPTLFGTNRDETKLFMAFDPRRVVIVKGLPVWIRDPDAYDREADYRGQLWKANGVDSIARRITAAGVATFAYRWDWRDEGRRFGIVDVSRLIGAAHGLEIPFVLGTFDSTPSAGLLFDARNEAERLPLSAAMMSYWTNFAATGNPARGRDGTLPEWPAWSNAAHVSRLMVLDAAHRGGIRASDEEVDREAVLARMEATEPDTAAACAMFRATFRSAYDAWQDAAWQRFKHGFCAREPRRPPTG